MALEPNDGVGSRHHFVVVGAHGVALTAQLGTQAAFLSVGGYHDFMAPGGVERYLKDVAHAGPARPLRHEVMAEIACGYDFEPA